MKNRLTKPPVPAEKILTPQALAQDFATQVENAQDTDKVTIPITTTRQASTTDAFRLTPREGRARPSEIVIGWKGLAHFFVSFDAADVVCYVTSLRQKLYPDNPENWTAVARNWDVERLPGPGGQVEPKPVTDLLPPTAPREHSRIERHNGGIFVPPSPRELENRLKQLVGH